MKDWKTWAIVILAAWTAYLSYRVFVEPVYIYQEHYDSNAPRHTQGEPHRWIKKQMVRERLQAAEKSQGEKSPVR